MRLSRQLSAALLALTTLGLCAAVWWVYTGAVNLAQVRAKTSRLSTDLAAAQAQSSQFAQMERIVAERQELKKRVEQSGLVESQWGSRVIQRPTSLVPRDEAEKFLKQLVSRAGEYWFAADSLDISVGVLSQGLFTSPTIEDRGFNVQVNGVFYFKVAGK